MKSCSTTLKRSQDKLLVLACVPAFGIIGIIAYIYTCCSGTDTEGKSAKGDREEDVENTEMSLTGSGKKPDNLNNGSNSDCSLLREGDCTKHNDSDDGYISNGTSTHSTLSNLKKCDSAEV